MIYYVPLDVVRSGGQKATWRRRARRQVWLVNFSSLRRSNTQTTVENCNILSLKTAGVAAAGSSDGAEQPAHMLCKKLARRRMPLAPL
jgi:hypothetical protein